MLAEAFVARRASLVICFSAIFADMICLGAGMKSVSSQSGSSSSSSSSIAGTGVLSFDEEAGAEAEKNCESVSRRSSTGEVELACLFDTGIGLRQVFEVGHSDTQQSDPQW
jgi:hypothetical protein